MRKKQKDKIRTPRGRVKEIIKDDFFQQEIKRLRLKWGIPEEGFQEGKPLQKWYEKLYSQTKPPKNSEFKKDLLDLRNVMNLSDYWAYFLERYLKFNDTYSLWGNNTLLETQFDPDTGESKLYLRIWEHTTIEDIINFWSEVESAQGHIRGFKKTFRDSNPKILQRDAFIYELHLNGKSTREICDQVYSNFFVEGDEQDNIYDMTEDAVRKAVSRIKSKNVTSNKNI